MRRLQKCRDLASDLRGMCAVKPRVIIGNISLKGEEKSLNLTLHGLRY